MLDFHPAENKVVVSDGTELNYTPLDAVYPPFKQVLPNLDTYTPSAQPYHFDPWYLSDFALIGQAVGKKGFTSMKVYSPSCPNSPVTFVCGDFHAVLMPRKA